MKGRKVLVVEDDVFIREMVELAFLREGAEVVTEADGQEGLRSFFDFRPDLVIMDIMMPHIDGWQLINQIRQLADTPVIMLTAVSDEDAIVRGLEMGATDYVTKPFSIKVLVARAKAALRPLAKMEEPSKLTAFKDHRLAIDLEYRRVEIAGEAVRLTDTEFRLLSYMLENRNRVLSFNQILEEIWGPGYEDSISYVHVYISRLRKKLEVDPKNPLYILNEHQVGYRFVI